MLTKDVVELKDSLPECLVVVVPVASEEELIDF